MSQRPDTRRVSVCERSWKVFLLVAVIWGLWRFAYNCTKRAYHRELCSTCKHLLCDLKARCAAICLAGEMKGGQEWRERTEWGENKGPLAFHCCANESHFVFCVSARLLFPLADCVCACVYCPLSLPASTFLTQAFLFLMENKDWRVAEMEAPNEKHGVSDLRPGSVHPGPKACISPALLLLLLCCHWCPHIDVKEDVGQKWLEGFGGDYFQLGNTKVLYSTCETNATLQRLTRALQTHLASVSLQFSDGT